MQMRTTCSQTLRSAEFMIKAVKRAYSSINSVMVAKMPALAATKTSTSTLKTSLGAVASMAVIDSNISSKNRSLNTSRRQMCSNSI